MYLVYADEFGHVGPYTGRNDPKFNESPVFGLGGIVLPVDQVRPFATWFFKLKSNLLDWEIQRSGEPAYSWEKKGSQLYTTENVLKYRELRIATNRILRHLHSVGGSCFFVGLEKYATPAEHNSQSVYMTALRETIRRVDEHCDGKDCNWLLIMDEHEAKFRKHIVSTAAISMFGPDKRTRLIEPPTQAESHLFQTIQCADWICGLVGRLGAYVCRPDEYPDLDWTVKYFQGRLYGASCVAKFRRKPRIEPAPSGETGPEV